MNATSTINEKAMRATISNFKDQNYSKYLNMSTSTDTKSRATSMNFYSTVDQRTRASKMTSRLSPLGLNNDTFKK